MSDAGSANVFNNGKVYVRREMCSTCIFAPGNRMQLRSGRVKDMLAATQGDPAGNIPCHQTIYGLREQEAICRGFFDKYATPVLRMAEARGIIEEVD